MIFYQWRSNFKFIEKGGSCHAETSFQACVYCHRFKIVLRIGLVRRARSGSVDDESGRGESVADGENDLSGGVTVTEILWCAGASQVI